MKTISLVVVVPFLAVGLVPTAAQATCPVLPTAIAHRGGSESYTENTRKAWQDSMKHGLKIMETDVRFTKDNVPVIMHDATVDRTTNGTGTVASMTLAKLRTFRTPDGQYVPTLWEYLYDVKAGKGTALVELKTTPTIAQWTAFNSRFNEFGMKSSAIIDSFDKHFLTTVKAQGYPKTAWVDPQGAREPSEITPYAKIYFKDYRDVTTANYQKWASAGITVYPWTVDSSADWNKLKFVPAIVTNKPKALMTWRGTQCSS